MGIVGSGLQLAFMGKVGFPEILAFPSVGVIVLSLSIVYVRAGSIREFPVLLFIMLYSFLWIPARIWKDKSYMTDVTCSIEGGQLKTQIKYLGLTAYFYSDVEDAVDEYLDLVDDDGEITLKDSTNIQMFESRIEGANCSTCVRSDMVNSSVDVLWSYNEGISWTLSLCSKCWSRVVKEQLRVLSEESDFESRVVIEQL